MSLVARRKVQWLRSARTGDYSRGMATVRKAVVPAAGRGTRFMPASKAIPKELLPVVDRPALDYVLDEARRAGLTSVAVITTEGKEALAAHFSHDAVLEAHLEASGDAARLASVKRAAALAPAAFVIQDVPRGLGHAIGCAEDFVAGESFAVLLGDDFCDERDPALPAMLALHELTGKSVLLLVEVTPELIRLYGSVDGAPLALASIPGATSDHRITSDSEVRTVTRLNEKPAPGEEYSLFAIIGRYVFTPAIFDAIRDTPAGRGGEIQLTDAIDRLTRTPEADGGGVIGVVYRGRRYDTGDKLEYLKAIVTIASDRPDLGPDFSAWLNEFVAERKER